MTAPALDLRPGAAGPVLVAHDLTYDYGRHRALDGVGFELARGEVLGLLGPNGAGKSTCLRLLTGYLTPTRGYATLAGFDVTRDGPQARTHLGYVPEDPLLYPHLTVDELLRLFARLKALPAATQGDECDRVAQRLALNAVRKRAAGKLSRGFRQRVAIALALLGGPDLLILDEPTNGLDPWQVIELRELILQLATEHAIIVTSHVLSEIERVAQRALFLRDGRLLGSYLIQRDQPGDLERQFLALTRPPA